MKVYAGVHTLHRAERSELIGGCRYGPSRGRGMILDFCYQGYLQPGHKKYLTAALTNFPPTATSGNLWKDPAPSMHNAAVCIGDLQQAAQD